MLELLVEAIIVIGLIILALRSTLRIVPQGSVGVIERLGRFHHEAPPGLVIKLPLVDNLKFVSTKSVTVALSPEPVITADNVSPVIDAYFLYQVVDAKSYLYEIQNPELAIKNIVSSTLRSEVGQRKLAEVMTHREQINAALRNELDELTGPWGIRIVQASIRQVDLTDEMQKAMEAQKKADANKLAAIEQAQGQKEASILQAEGARQAAIMQAEGEQKAMILRADAAKQARILEAEAEAIAIRKLAEAQAEATQVVNRAILGLAEDDAHKWHPEKIQAILQLKSLETLTAVGQSQSTKLVLPGEITGLAGLIDTLKTSSSGTSD
ncbi:SPFH domain-containing protein [Sulfobacillus thermosulfidooxidans]|uniref:SPFH domain-containing protein n=1 Tax=Sulfobacillus thermosulfidooxidans TaxID=28034 RepID=UPI0006B6924F|nr:SPFH domain-containing protein [Sulfobacillus thermosulfidooxidans]